MKVIIVGAGAIGVHLADLFSKIKQDIVIIDDDEEKLERIQADCDLMTVHASSNTPIKSLKDAGVKNADLFIAVTRDENLNLSLCVLAKSMGTRRTVAKVENVEFTDPQIIESFQAAGIGTLHQCVGHTTASGKSASATVGSGQQPGDLCDAWIFENSKFLGAYK